VPHEAKVISLDLFILPLFEHDRLKWSCDKYITERGNILGFEVMV